MSIVGIDLGTTNSAVATLWMDRPEIIPNRYGTRTTPSVVGISRRHKILVGVKAKYQRVTLLQPPVEEVKRLMGQDCTIMLGDKVHSPQAIAAYILRSIKMDAEQFLGEPVESAVITIPAYFNESARRATRKAGEIAGLQVAMILDEPTASALAYGVTGEKDETVLVYDLGGGTFDVSIIEIAGHHFEVLAIDGNIHLGGKDFDRLLCQYVLDEIKAQHKIKVPDHCMQKLSVAVEAAKCDLSFYKDTSVIWEAFTEKHDICVDIKRELLEELIRPLILSTLEPIQHALDKANLRPNEIDKILLVGGSTRIPLVHQMLTELFQKPPRDELNPDECVALGAAIYTKLLPSASSKTYHSAGFDEHIAEDALVVVPRTAYALGIGVDEGGNTYSIILPVGAFYPVSITRKDYFTSVMNQKGIEIWIYEGNDPIATKNTPLGRLLLDLPPGLPAGVPIWITFSLNESRILEASVTLPDRPNLSAKVRIDTANKPNITSTTSTETPKTEHMEPIVSGLQHQLNTFSALLQEKKQWITPSRYIEAAWALRSAQEALTAGNSKLAGEKIHLLDSIREELLSLSEPSES